MLINVFVFNAFVACVADTLNLLYNYPASRLGFSLAGFSVFTKSFATDKPREQFR